MGVGSAENNLVGIQVRAPFPDFRPNCIREIKADSDQVTGADDDLVAGGFRRKDVGQQRTLDIFRYPGVKLALQADASRRGDVLLAHPDE